jgi:RES domain-containing protein
MTSQISNALGSVTASTVAGNYFRRVDHETEPLGAHRRGGRWSVRDEALTLYLSQPLDSALAEAYRHFFDRPAEKELRGQFEPKLFREYYVQSDGILDLTMPDQLQRFGIRESDLVTRVGDWGACQAIGSQAFLSGFKGVMAPAASGIGVTLALFMDARAGSPQVTPMKLHRFGVAPVDPRIGTHE